MMAAVAVAVAVATAGRAECRAVTRGRLLPHHGHCPYHAAIETTMPVPSAAPEGQTAVLHGQASCCGPWCGGDLDALVRHAYNDPQVACERGERFPSPHTRADGDGFLAGHVVAADGLPRAIEIGRTGLRRHRPVVRAQSAPLRRLARLRLGRAY